MYSGEKKFIANGWKIWKFTDQHIILIIVSHLITPIIIKNSMKWIYIKNLQNLFNVL